MMIAFPAVHAPVLAPLELSLRVTASTLSMLILASSAVLVQMLAPFQHLNRNNSF